MVRVPLSDFQSTFQNLVRRSFEKILPVLHLFVSKDRFKHTNFNIERDKWGIARSFTTLLLFEDVQRAGINKMKKTQSTIIDDALTEHKIYKEKPYKNSNADPFGVTLNGKSKDYIQAHNKLRDIIKKGKIYDVEYNFGVKNLLKKGKIKFLSVVSTKTIVDATVEVVPQEGPRGNVQLKSHNPSGSKKKGATTELRKLPDYEYSQVEVLKAILKNILDRLIAGDSIEQAISGAKSESEVKEIIISCDVCNFETKSKAGLKIHKTRIHKNDLNKCTSCDFVATNNVDIKEHDETQHNTKEGIRKRPAPSYECDVPHCPFTFDSKQKLIEHAQSQHSKCEQANEHSPSTSPSRKKIVISDNSIKDNGINDVEMEETEEISKSILAQLQMKIEQLELKIQEEKDEKEKMKVEIDQLKTKHASGSAFGGFTQKVNKKPFKIPSHLRSVANNHLTQLRGFKMRYCALPDGACLTNCLTAHISLTDDEEECKRNNRRVNEHIADHFDDYYQNKIILPYIETVGVGSYSRTVVFKTKEEFKAHLIR